MAAGLLLGGALVALANWRAVFVVNVIIAIPARSAASAPRLVHRRSR